MTPLPDPTGFAEAREFTDTRWRSRLRQAVSQDRRLRIRRALIETRAVSEAWCRLDPRMAVTRVTSETKLVMDGFPRSANSYAHMAFLLANGAEFPLSSHRHSHQSVLTGVRRDIPTVVLIREPGPAIGSALQHSPTTRPASGIDMYRAFYEGALPVVDEVLVATFEEVITDFGDVIRRCNARFGTEFVVYEKTDEAEAEVFRSVEAMTAYGYGEAGHEGRVPRPSGRRRPADEVLSRLGDRDRAELGALDDLYRAFIERRRG